MTDERAISDQRTDLGDLTDGVHFIMVNVLLGIGFVVVCVALFAWRMVRDAPSVVSGEPVQPELRGPTGLATGDYTGIAAGADGSMVGGDGGGGALP